MSSLRVLVLGGYGFFGRRLVDRLSCNPGLHILVAGRSLEAGRDFVQQMRRDSLEAVLLDSEAPDLQATLRKLTPGVLVNASGPFQGADYRLPAACIASGIDYVDLADGRDYVTGIRCLHDAAVDAGVTVTTGASSVPALSSAAVDHLVQDFSIVRWIDIGISPGNRTERGLSTVRSILTYCGKPLPTTPGTPLFGWSGTRRHHYPEPVGARLLSPCDVPDLALLPARYAGTPDVRFGAGLELQFLHRGMNVLAWMARQGFVRDWSRYARPLLRLADLFRTWGSDAGAMHVRVRGVDRSGAPVTRTWHLLATEGDGPFVPTLAAAAFIRKLQARAVARGAYPCLGALTLSDVLRETQGLAIRTEVLA